MSDMKCSIKCPMCGEILQKYGEIDPKAGTSIVLGANCPKCGIGNSDIKLWQTLIQAKQDLVIALTAIKEISEECGCLMAALKRTGFESVVETFYKNIRKKLKQIEHKK